MTERDEVPEVATQAIDTTAWHATPVDPASDEVTEVIKAELLEPSAHEGGEASALDNLFGDTQFQEYDDRTIAITPPHPAVTTEPRAGIAKPQQVLLWVAGGLVALLALVALFLVGKALADTWGAAPAVSESASPSPTPTPTPTPTALAVGPVAPGQYPWDALLGGECLAPFTSAWQESYTVVACSTPHPAQLILRGQFADASGVAYPGTDELQKRMNELCTPTTVIDYSKAGMLSDVQVLSSFAADAADWADGNRTFYCFVTRSSGQYFTESVATAAP